MKSTASEKKRRSRRNYTPEFRAEAVKLVSQPGQTIASVSRTLDLTESSLRNWVKQAEHDQSPVPQGALTASERAELAELRKENKLLKMEKEILRKATAFFAREQM